MNAISSRRTGAPPHHALALFKRYIAGKIVIPYLLVIFLIAVLATYITMHLIADSLEEKFREELAGGGRSANEAMVMIERDQLIAIRNMSFTLGVDTAISEFDVDGLEALLAPIAANLHLSYVDVLHQDGTQLLGLRAPDLGPDAASRLDPNAHHWAPLRAALNGQPDELGDRFADVVSTPWGPLLVTAGPVRTQGVVVGAIAVGLPIEEAATRLSRESGSKGITLYRKNGALLTSTLRASAASLTSSLILNNDLAADIGRGEMITIRRTAIGDQPYVETLGVLAIRRQPALLLGVGSLVNIIQDRGAHTRNLMFLIFSLVIVLVLAVGLMLARQISRPVRALVTAVDRVRRNDLNFELPVQSEDETGILTSAFNEMTGGLRERERSRVAIEKYMSPKVYRLIQSGELQMGGESREITVFKTDIRDFTGLSGSLDPHALITLLNRYFERMVVPVTKYAGEVDKYMGDAILAKFGATEWYPDHARRAILAMIEIIEACEQFSAELQAEGKPPLRMGIGANTGAAVVGNVGSTERMEYTIISDAVNTAQRIEELCREFGWDLLISEHTHAQAKDQVEVGTPWRVQLRGQSGNILVYPVLGRRGDVPLHRRRAYERLVRREEGVYGRLGELVPA